MNDRQSHARAFEFVGAMQALEDAEQFAHILHAKTHAIVFDGIRAFGATALSTQCNSGLLRFAAILQRVGYEVAKDLRDFRLVGGYALQPVWNDGHETGLYTFRQLRSLDETDHAAA